MPFTDTSEKGFQKYIVKELTAKGGYVESVSNDFDKKFCINTGQLLLFIEETRPEKYEMKFLRNSRKTKIFKGNTNLLFLIGLNQIIRQI